MDRSRQSASTTTRRAVSNRVVEHEVIVHHPATLWSSERYTTALRGSITDWSWQPGVSALEARWPGSTVTVYRGRGRHRRKVYETVAT